MSTDSEYVLHRVAAGEPGAVELCLDTFGGLVWSIARRLSPTPSDAEDAVQEIFLDVWKNAGRYDRNVAKESTFVAMIARRRLIDRLRKKSRQPKTASLSAMDRGGDEAAQMDVPHYDTQPDQIDDADETERIREFFGELKPDARRALELAVFEGHTQAEIAEILDLPLGTVKTHIRRSLIRVRELLQQSRAAQGAGSDHSDGE